MPEINFTNMNELSKFTTDELINELKKRIKNENLNLTITKRRTEYKYATGTVIDSSISFNGSRYKIELDQKYIDEYGINLAQMKYPVRPITGAFGSKTAPKVGDKVRLKCRITKTCPKFSMFYARITEIVERCYE